MQHAGEASACNCKPTMRRQIGGPWLAPWQSQPWKSWRHQGLASPACTIASTFLFSCWPAPGAVFEGCAVCSRGLVCGNSTLFSADRQHACARRTSVGRARARVSVHLRVSQEQHGTACTSLRSIQLLLTLQRPYSYGFTHGCSSTHRQPNRFNAGRGAAGLCVLPLRLRLRTSLC